MSKILDYILEKSENISITTLLIISFLLLSIFFNIYILMAMKCISDKIDKVENNIISEKEKISKIPVIIEYKKGENILPPPIKDPVKPEPKTNTKNVSNLKKEKITHSNNSIQKNKIIKFIQRTNKNINFVEAQYMAECFIDAGKMFNINPYLLASIAKAESTYYRHSVSKSGAIGLMQVNWKVHEKNLKKKFPHIKCRDDLKEIKNGILSGAYVLKRLMQNTKDINRCLYGYLGQNSHTYVKKIHKYIKEIENI